MRKKVRTSEWVVPDHGAGQRACMPPTTRAFTMSTFKAILLLPCTGDLLQFLANQGSCFEVFLLYDAKIFGVEGMLCGAGHHGLPHSILSNLWAGQTP